MYKAIGVIELKSIPKGVEAADAALKSAGVDMVSSHPSCPGKYEIILSGSISNITAAVSHVTSRFEGHVIDSVPLYFTATFEPSGAFAIASGFFSKKRLSEYLWFPS